MTDKACRSCRTISMGSICPNCKSTNLSEDWSGLVIIFDVENSEVARKMKAEKPGRYAVRVR